MTDPVEDARRAYDDGVIQKFQMGQRIVNGARTRTRNDFDVETLERAYDQISEGVEEEWRALIAAVRAHPPTDAEALLRDMEFLGRSRLLPDERMLERVRGALEALNATREALEAEA